MTLGDEVKLNYAPDVTGTIVKMPRSEGRKRPRCVIRTPEGDERWVHLDELSVVRKDDGQSATD